MSSTWGRCLKAGASSGTRRATDRGGTPTNCVATWRRRSGECRGRILYFNIRFRMLKYKIRPLPTRRVDAVRRIRAGPRRIRRRTVNWWDRSIQQAQIDRQLRPVMRGVQDTAPEDPHPRALDIEELHRLVPPRARAAREMWQSGPGKIRDARDGCIDRHRIRYDRCGIRLGQSKEFAEEASS